MARARVKLTRCEVFLLHDSLECAQQERKLVREWSVRVPLQQKLRGNDQALRAPAHCREGGAKWKLGFPPKTKCVQH